MAEISQKYVTSFGLSVTAMLRYGHLVTEMSVTEKYVTSYVSVTGFGLSVTAMLRYVTDILLRKCP